MIYRIYRQMGSALELGFTIETTEQLSEQELADHAMHVMTGCVVCGRITAELTECFTGGDFTREQLIRLAQTFFRLLSSQSEPPVV